ncbi:MAG: preprotein translocase subunit YajC [Actinomycetota bacterium]|nr:preprotein translocase subunit YajC [Actinomycetota bacterium]
MGNIGNAFIPIMLLLFVGMIFLSGRKQRKQAQEVQQMQSELANGDVVITTSGLRGTVVDASYEETIDLEIAPGVVTTWVRPAVRERVNPATGSGAEASPEGEIAGDSAAERPGA